jgi:FkbM family methyltransferase
MHPLNRLKSGVRAFIGRRRTSAVVRSLHDAAAFVESAYRNEGSDFFRNGERRVLARLVAVEPRVAFDIGANTGDWTLEALQIWPACHIHAFEVAPPTFKQLTDRLTDGSRSRVTAQCLGLSDSAGPQQMFFFPDHPELTADRPRHEGKAVEPFEAELERGDAYVERHGIESIDFLKVDVEGAEYRVLNGFTRTLNAGRIQCLQFEYGAFSIQTRVLLADYYSMLRDRFWIGKIYPAAVEFGDYDWRMEDFRFANFCAVSRGRADIKRLLES